MTNKTMIPPRRRISRCPPLVTAVFISRKPRSLAVTRDREVRRKNTIAISIMGVLSIVLLVIIGVALTQDYSSHPPHKTSRDNSYDAGGNKSRNETSADDIEHVNRTNNVIGDE